MIKSKHIIRKGTQLKFRIDPLPDRGQKEKSGDIVTVDDMAYEAKLDILYLSFEEDVDLLYTYNPRLFEIYKQPWE